MKDRRMEVNKPRLGLREQSVQYAHIYRNTHTHRHARALTHTPFKKPKRKYTSEIHEDVHLRSHIGKQCRHTHSHSHFHVTA